MILKRQTKDHFKSMVTMTGFWIIAAVLFVTFRYYGMEREILGLDANYFFRLDGSGVDSIEPQPFRLEIARAYWEMIIGSVVVGIVTSFAEITIFSKFFRKRSFSTIIIAKTLFYLVVLIVAVLISAALSVTLLQDVTLPFMEAYSLQISNFFTSIIFHQVLILAIIVSLLTNFFRQISAYFGKGTLFKLITGKYHSPREEERIFMFLDLKSSTTIAEKLGHIRFSEFLKDYFFDISEEIYKNNGEVYQYVGDEVVVTWEKWSGITANQCIQCHFDIMKRLEKVAPVYIAKYGVAPSSKSGFHIGKVVTTEVGEMKQEIVYHGDTVNTASRIQGECNKYGKSILVSGELIGVLNMAKDFHLEMTGTTLLRGKEQTIELYSVTIA